MKKLIYLILLLFLSYCVITIEQNVKIKITKPSKKTKNLDSCQTMTKPKPKL